MSAVLSLTGSLLGDVAIKSTLIALLGAVTVLLARRASAAWRHMLWTATLAAVLALPFAAITLPTIALPVLQTRLPARPIPAPVAPASTWLRLPPNQANGVHLTVSSGMSAIVATPRQSWPFGILVGALWIIGVAGFLMRFAIGAAGVRRLTRSSLATEDSRLLVRARHLAERLGLTRHVAIRLARRDCIPVTWGVITPTVLLPAAWDSWDDERLDAVLLHELGHVARFDALTQMIAQLATAFFWFNPLVCLVARQARIDRERACDDLVLANGTRPSRYAGDLLALVGLLEAPGGSAFASLARRSDLAGRVRAILDPAPNRRGITRTGASGAAALWLVLLLVAPLAVASGAVAPPHHHTPLSAVRVPAAVDTPPPPRTAQAVTPDPRMKAVADPFDEATQDDAIGGENGRPAVASDSVPRSIAEAELQGSRYPAATRNNPPRNWDSAAVGPNERRCVDVDTVSIARSGDFVVGPFALYNQAWQTGFGKLIWQPAQIVSLAGQPTLTFREAQFQMPTLTVRAARLDGAPGPHLDPSYGMRVYEGIPITWSDRAGTKFYVTGAHMPTTGRWMMVATAGANWGCFILTVQ